MDTPILFLIFNRPDTTQKVFEQIREIKPKYLYVAADGPRGNKVGEYELCERTRAIINVDWNCEVKTLYRDVNLGCGLAVSQAISWFFEQEEKGIILEDDCLPNQSFFKYCELLLIKYKDEQDIMMIGGSSWISQEMNIKYDSDYFFTNVCSVWGWASWSRAWAKYKYKISSEMLQNANNNLVWKNIKEKDLNKFKKQLLKATHDGVMDTWDIQWDFCISINNGMAILPIKNLVSNIGIQGTNYSQNTPLHNLKTYTLSVDKIKHPKELLIDSKMDQFYQKTEVDLFLKNNEPILRYGINKMKYYILKLIKTIK